LTVARLGCRADGRLVAEDQLAGPRYRGLLHGLQTVLREEGPRGLWRGSAPAVQRAALVNLGVLGPLASPMGTLAAAVILRPWQCFVDHQGG
jgi:Mitochondrial carrier protein